MAALAEMPFTSIGIVDDDPGDADVRKYQIEEAGARPVLFEKGFTGIENLISTIRASGVEGVICDHRLTVRNYAPFNGAEAVARLFEAKIPAVLISKYAQIDVDAHIRPYRERIPVLLSKDDLDPEALIAGLTKCKSEMAGTIPPSRRSRRTLVRIDEFDKERDIVDAFIPAWNPNQAVRFPLSIIPESHRTNLKRDDRFFAKVNTDAASAEELFFRDFEPAPKVDTNDEIF